MAFVVDVVVIVVVVIVVVFVVVVVIVGIVVVSVVVFLTSMNPFHFSPTFVGFWTIYGDDWDTSIWKLKTQFPFDYRFNTLGYAMQRSYMEMGIDKQQCVKGRRLPEILYDWFLNYLDAHRTVGQMIQELTH